MNSVVCAAALLLPLCSMAAFAAKDEKPVPPQGLGNTFAKLAVGKPVTVGYFGGSITEGAGASKPDETSWRGRTTAWLRAQYPKAPITEVNAAIGGTGSDLGAFRCERDLLSRRPDLVFVEFAVNDSGAAPERATRTMEGIVRQIRHADARTDIAFVYTTTHSLVDPYERGETPPMIVIEQKVAAHYGIPEVNVGKALWQTIHDQKGTWETLTVDSVHPNDAGYAIYTDGVTGFLDSHRKDKPGGRRSLPKPMAANAFEKARMVDAWEIPGTGWTKDPASLAGRYPHFIAASAAGTELKYAFTGTTIGLYWMMAPDSGDIEWSVDGSAPQRVSSWDRFARDYARANSVILSDSLKPGNHVLTVRVLSGKNAESKGTVVRIGALMVSE